jgi:hypothetical protein
MDQIHPVREHGNLPQTVFCYKTSTTRNYTPGGDDIKVAAMIAHVKAGFLGDILKTFYLHFYSGRPANVLKSTLYSFIGDS